jgi:hypothetical protein
MKIQSLITSALLLVIGCSSESGGSGILDLNAYGEAFIEEGIPADAFADGWAVTFERFDVKLVGVVAAGHEFGSYTVDLTEDSDGEGHVLDSTDAPTGEVDDAEFEIERVTLEGAATKGDTTKTFAWTFSEPVRYHECESGPTLQDGATGTFQITVHADHLFYDSLVSEEPDMRFQALADADADDDGVITQDELEVADIGLYDAGSEGTADNLWLFLTAQSHTLGHVNGEGHCHAEVIE